MDDAIRESGMRGIQHGRDKAFAFAADMIQRISGMERPLAMRLANLDGGDSLQLTAGLEWVCRDRLEPAAGKDGAFRHSARELLALSAWRANDTTATRQWLDMIANDGDTPPGLRSRAEALQALLPPVAKS